MTCAVCKMGDGKHAAYCARRLAKLVRDADRWGFVAASRGYQGSSMGYPTFTEAVDAGIADLRAAAPYYKAKK